MHRVHRPVALVALAAACLVAQAAPTIVKVGEPLARFELLQPGVHRYLRYEIHGDERRVLDIWTRRVGFESQDGQRRLHVHQRWDEAVKPAVVLELDSWFEPGTFRPLTHTRRLDKAGVVTERAFRFEPGRLVEQGKDEALATPEPVFNFEVDMEMLQALPLAEGYEADLPFLDAGVDKPGRYVFKVAGAQAVAGPDGVPIDCWLVTADYNTGKVVSRFWFAKKTQVLVREEAGLPDGGTIVKTLLAPEAA